MKIRKQFQRVEKVWGNAGRSSKALFLIIVIVSAIVVGRNMMPRAMIMGYDGIVSKVTEVKSDADYDLDFHDESSAGIDPPGYWSGIIWNNPTGVKIEIQSGVNVLEYEDLTEPINVTTDNGDGTYCNFSATVKTYGDGFEPIEDIEFWISLAENDFSVFQEPDETYAFILAVYTTAAATKTGILDAVPEAGGYYFPYTTVETSPVPQWLVDSGYTGNLGNMAKVKFLIRVEKAQPTTWMSIYRAESQMTFHIGVDVFMAGHWEKTTDYKRWDPPKPEVPWWEQLFADLFGEMDSTTMLLTFVVIVILIFIVVKVAKRLFSYTPAGMATGVILR
jgi:hypothetical protein